MNCMPTGDDVDDFRCWPVKQPVTYKVQTRVSMRGSSKVNCTAVLLQYSGVCSLAGYHMQC
jgi:hypothetical protein